MSKPLQHYSQLDGLRALAVISVMIGHWIAWETNNETVKNIPWGHGVMLFFVLSGYLITQILLNQKKRIEEKKQSIFQALKIFYIRRFLRIFPIYYLLLFFLWYNNYTDINIYLASLLSYTSNIDIAIRGELPGSYSHLWSLAVEEQFYLFWPFLLFFVPRKKIGLAILISILISFVSRAACAILFNLDYINWMWGAYFTPNLILPLALGALLAYLKTTATGLNLIQKLAHPGLLYLSILFYCLCYYFLHINYVAPFYFELFDEYLFSVMCFFILLRASENGYKYVGGFILNHEILVFTGKISYGLYLYHMFMGPLFWNYISPQFAIHIELAQTAWIIYFMLAFLIAIFSYYFIETPLNNLKRYFSY